MQLWDISRRRQCQYMLFGDNVCFLGIIRVKDNAIYASHVTPNFPFSRNAHTNARKVEVYEYKLVLNCGQFYTLFSL